MEGGEWVVSSWFADMGFSICDSIWGLLSVSFLTKSIENLTVESQNSGLGSFFFQLGDLIEVTPLFKAFN